MSESEFELEMDELSSAEEFLDYFGIVYEQSVVHVNRLHILQRFHNNIAAIDEMPESDEERRDLYAALLNSAYNDFVKSDAVTEKVFKVFHMHEPVKVEVSLMDLTQQVASLASKV